MLKLLGAFGPLMEGGSESSSLTFTTLISALTGVVTAQDIITLMGSVVGAGLGIAVAYIFGRKLVRAFIRAIKGKAPTI